MGMMLPNDLVWVMEKLGFEWPDIDEDEVRRLTPTSTTNPVRSSPASPARRCPRSREPKESHVH